MTSILQEYAKGDQVLVDGKPGRIIVIRGQLATIMLAGGDETIKPISELVPYDTPAMVDEAGEHLEFLCDPDKDGCGTMIEAWPDERVKPGQAAVVVCDNCGLSWTVWNPPFETVRTDKFEAIWPIIGQ